MSEVIVNRFQSLAIRRFAVVFTGATPRRDDPANWDGGTIPWINSGAVNQRRIVRHSSLITKRGFQSSSTKWIPAGSVVIAMAGQGKTKGMAATVERPMTGNQSLAALIVNRRIMDYRYLAFALEPEYRNLRGVVGNEERSGLSLQDIRSFKIPVPSLEEQGLIVRYLDHAELRIAKAIVAKQDVVRLLREARLSIISETVLAGTETDVECLETGIPGVGSVPAHWRIRRAKYVWNAVDVRSVTGTEERLTVSSASGIVPRSSKNVTMFEAATYVGHKVVQPNDLVINSLWAWAGGLGVSSHHGLVSPVYGVYRLRDDAQSDPEFMHNLLRSNACQWQFQVRSKGIWRSRLSITDEAFFDMSLPLPPFEEQRTIAATIRKQTANVDMAIESVLQEIALLREYRTRLISDVVTGKLDVRDEAATLLEIDPMELATATVGENGDDEEATDDD